jgi:hypothetical protein
MVLVESVGACCAQRLSVLLLVQQEKKMENGENGLTPGDERSRIPPLPVRSREYHKPFW